MNDLTRPCRSRNRGSKGDSPKLVSDSEEEGQETSSRRKVTSFGGIGFLCAHCEKEGCKWFCIGPCRKAYHTKCKDKDLDLTHDSSLPENEEFSALDVLGWKCKECTSQIATCFQCGIKGNYLSNKDNAKDEGLVKCSLVNCGKFYHLSCLATKPKKSFMCPWHYCVQCRTTGNSKALLQCTRCPKAYHLRCYNRSVVRLNKKYIVCHQHKQPCPAPIYISQKALLKEIVPILKAKLKEFASKFSNLCQIEETKEPPLKKKRKVLGEEELNALYKKHNLSRPEEFDYIGYKGDWCRYCGARKSQWRSGPWGRKKLCEVHSEAWKDKKLPELHGSNEPEVPMHPEKNTEVLFLSKSGN